jgi:hypothetical protein
MPRPKLRDRKFLTIYLDKDVLDRLRELSFQRDESMASFIRRYVRKGLEVEFGLKGSTEKA